MKLSQILTTALLTVSANTLFAAEETPKVLPSVTTEVKTTTTTEKPAIKPQTETTHKSHTTKEGTTETVLLKPDAIKYKYEEETKKK